MQRRYEDAAAKREVRRYDRLVAKHLGLRHQRRSHFLYQAVRELRMLHSIVLGFFAILTDRRRK